MINKTKNCKPNVSGGFHFILMFTCASKFLILVCCSMLLAHYFCPNVRKSRKYRVCKLSLGANGTSVTPRTSTAKVATPREEIRFEVFFPIPPVFCRQRQVRESGTT